MRLSYLSSAELSRSLLSTFYGYKHTLLTEAGAFYDCANMTSDSFPVIRTRDRRRIVTEYAATVDGIVGKGKLGYVSGGKFYYDGTEVCSVISGSKKFVSMGAYLLIFPDKICFNTYSGNYSSMEASKTGSGLSVRSQTITGDTTYTKKWARVSASDAFSDFAVGDGIKLSWTYNGADYSLTCNISEVGTNYIDVDAAVSEIEGKTSGASAITVTREVPDMDYFTECNNRVWGCSSAKHEIYACKLGDPKNWNSFAGIASDSYAVTVGTDGSFTGAASYLDYVLFFKENCVHKVYGTKPANFQTTETELLGVREGSSKSIAKVGDALLYQSSTGIMAYTGGSTSSLISSAFGEDTYKNGVAGGFEGKYYISTQKDGGTDYTLFVYDVSKNIWHRDYDAVQVVDFAQTEAGFFGLYGNKLVFFDGITAPADGTDEGTLDFLLETGEFGLDTPDRKHISKIQLRVRLGTDTSLTVSAKYDNGEYADLQTFTAQEEKAVTIPIIPRRCDRVRFKLSGTGSIELYSIAFTTEGGTEL